MRDPSLSRRWRTCACVLCSYVCTIWRGGKVQAYIYSSTFNICIRSRRACSRRINKARSPEHIAYALSDAFWRAPKCRHARVQNDRRTRAEGELGRATCACNQHGNSVGSLCRRRLRSVHTLGKPGIRGPRQHVFSSVNSRMMRIRSFVCSVPFTRSALRINTADAADSQIINAVIVDERSTSR